MDILIKVVEAVVIFAAGLLVGRKNPSLAAAADAMVKAGEAKAQALIAAAKAKVAAAGK